MKIFDYENYKDFVNDWIISRPKKGHGEFQKMAKAISIHPTLVSHIFRGEKDFTLEQALKFARYLRLKEMESDYFLLLVQYRRAGTFELQTFLKRQIKTIKEKANQLVNRIQRNKILSEEDKALFYSNWYYSGIRLLTSLKGKHTQKNIAEFYNLPIDLVEDVLKFLEERDLCLLKDGKYFIGPAITHLDANSPFISSHHRNWRLKSMEKHAKLGPTELSFSAPLTISKEDAMKVRILLLEFIEDLSERVKVSESEEIMNINIDWHLVR